MREVTADDALNDESIEAYRTVEFASLSDELDRLGNILDEPPRVQKISLSMRPRKKTP